MNTFGKFESAAELLRAYCELEKAYTKKCQAFAELAKRMDEKVQNAEFEAEKDEFSVKNCDFEAEKEETTNSDNLGKTSGTIFNEDACKDSTTHEQIDVEGAEAQEKEDKPKQSDSEKVPVYMSPLWAMSAKEFFGSNKLAAAFERQILEAIAGDSELAVLPDALARAAERVLGKEVIKPEFCDEFVIAICDLPKVKKRVIDEYLKQVRGKGTSPVFVRSRTGTMSGNKKFGSIEEAGKYLFRTL